ncbi:MAG: hypothetical protein JNM56_22490 [Planctomycetia bacterium]|nr:hypothetical protein [Planctomycetia bacterium]
MVQATTSAVRKPARSIEVVAVEGDWFLLQIEAAGKLDFYIARKLSADFGQAYRLEKQAVETERAVEVYDVLLNGSRSSCDCPGGCYRPHRPCKHVAGLLALAAQGKLPGYRSPSLREVDGPFIPGRSDEPEENIFYDTRRCGCRSSEEHELCCLLPQLDAEYNAAVA